MDRSYIIFIYEDFETDIKMSIYLNIIVCHSGSQINIWKSLSRIVSLLVSLVDRSFRSIVWER